MIIKWIKKIRDSRELKKSNWGREFNWYIEYNGKIIGELINYKWKDMFWDTYIVKSFNEDYNQILTDSLFWDNFKYKNQYYLQYVDAFIAGGHKQNIELNERISIRGLYLIELK
ncbi:hypothetical protein J2Q11_11415 [Tenacibaculum finnmarkense genomovar finnmarkense]|nr:hypothetical protein [Tenacibaculum finnmarkense]MCD8418303.1 hypothetical protein [Tenacibaculum finnmarkense genomovar finnmarkense]MCG8186664.1 hypothetical protein [Tenacibaculum finnmarkense genomovar finnmarkense]MCG8203198.1 hypothetical protein [Tenacibaculum finnmarkense genomovar finnmarkense]MCG8210571.1 hypothetical protein [Tenacibaculum finnmarkense genomovar finnmarkense]MCG8213432.1 hypothetical protein [Tenacibaculum finnmarkense genomovar finnmarkense]